MGSKGSTTTSSYQVPQWENTDWTNLVNQANGQVNADINSVNYGGIENQMSNSTQNILNQQVNPSQLASEITQAGQANWTSPGTAQSYMDPYENTALSSQVSLDRQNLLAPELASIDQSAAASGALGGDRDQVMKSQAMNNFNNTEANQIAQGMNTAYQTGANQFNSDAARNLAGQQAGAQTQLAGANSNVYANYAAGQNNLNAIMASEAPGQQLQGEAGILAALPRQGTEQQTTTPNGGMLGGILGGILGGAGQLMTGLGGMGLKFSKGGIVRKRSK